MLQRVTDGQRYVALIRHPRVAPGALLGQDVDDAALIAAAEDPENVCLLMEHGGFLFVRVTPELYEVHTAFTPEGRGPQTSALARESVAFMFTKTEALAIRTFVAHDNGAARRLAMGVGFVPLRDAATLGTPGVEYLLTVKQWAKEFKCQPQQLGQLQA